MTPASPTALEQAERRLGVRFPASFSKAMIEGRWPVLPEWPSPVGTWWEELIAERGKATTSS